MFQEVHILCALSNHPRLCTTSSHLTAACPAVSLASADTGSGSGCFDDFENVNLANLPEHAVRGPNLQLGTSAALATR